MTKGCTLSTDSLPVLSIHSFPLTLGGLSNNSVVMITDSPNMTSAVYPGLKTTTNKRQRVFCDNDRAI